VIRQSTSRTGSRADDAAAESFFATIKAEIDVNSWPDLASARRDIENWIKTYNERRSTLRHQLPNANPNPPRLAAAHIQRRINESGIQNRVDSKADDPPEPHRLATGIRRDLDAVTNALTLEHSSGAVEGNATRIEQLKRDGYHGRAEYDVLRARILHAPAPVT
jgi:hypothetical protein